MSGQKIQFADGLDGELFEPASASRAGAVVILHERYGLVQHTLDLAQKLADDGFVALAPDLFSRWSGDRQALTRGDVRAVLPDPEVSSVVEAGITYLHQHAHIGPEQMAIMGVCQSGRYVPVVASRLPSLAAGVIFYGAAQNSDWEVTDVQPRPMDEMIHAMKAPTLLVFGEADHVISVDEARRLRNTFEDASLSYRMKLFANMPHGWLNDTMPGRYREREATETWTMLVTFLRDVFARRWPASDRVCWEFASNIGRSYDFGKNVRLE